MANVDISLGIKKELTDKAENIIGDFGKIAQSVLKQSGLHDSLVQTARTFAATETTINATAESLKQMKHLTLELQLHVDQISTSMQQLGRLNSMLIDTQQTAIEVIRNDSK